MKYTFMNLKKRIEKSDKTKEEILKKCKVATKYDIVLANGTSQEQYELGECLVNSDGFLNITETSLIALPLYYAAANKGHVLSQYRMYIYLNEDKHKDAIIYLKMAVENGHEPAYYVFFRNYLQKRKAYLAEPLLFKKILKHFEKSKDEDIRVDVGLYYENRIHDYKKAIKFYKGTLFSGEIERLKMVVNEQEHPNKSLREEIVKKYPKIYKIINNKIIHYKDKSYA